MLIDVHATSRQCWERYSILSVGFKVERKLPSFSSYSFHQNFINIYPTLTESQAFTEVSYSSQ